MSSQVQRPIGFRPEEISAIINEAVVQQHAENAAFLWGQRDRAVGAPHFSLNDLADWDERVEANIDGLRVAGNYGWRLCEEALGREEGGEVFAAGVLAFESGNPDRIAKVLEVACSAPELERGLISALAWTPMVGMEKHLRQLISSDTPAARRIGIGTFVARRQDPGAVLASLLVDGDPRVRAETLKAVAELGRVDLLPLVLQAIGDEDKDCRFYAAWSAARFGQRTEPVVQTLIDYVAEPGPHRMSALGMALRVLDPASAIQWLRQLWQQPAYLRVAAIGTGALGDPELVSVLIEVMQVNAVARVAGESFSMITGVDLAYDDLDQDMPEDFESGPTEDAGDEDVALDADQDLPWPDSELVATWWSSNSSRFQPGRRYLNGRDIGVNSSRQTLVDGKQRQRVAAALELALLEPNEPILEVRARGGLQQRWVQAWTS